MHVIRERQAFSITMLPADDGDCLFVEAGGCRIVVDGGRAATGKTVLPAFLRSLPHRPERATVDLLILTHIDADHIEGLLEFLPTMGEISVGEVWFNGLHHHKQATGAFALPAVGIRTDKEPALLGVAQALRFEELLKPNRLVWNAAFAGGPVMIEREGELPRVALSESASIVLLGPPRAKLAALYPQWNDIVGEQQEKHVENLMVARPREVPTVQNLARLAGEMNTPDVAAPNGASIAFALEAGGKRSLFAADAHPDDLTAALERYSATRPIWFDAVKVAHHGSARNNTEALISRLSSSCWLISTNGSRHGHPDEEAVARIVQSGGPSKRLIFNYRSSRNSVWSDESLQRRFDYVAEYGCEQKYKSVNL